MDKVYYIKGSSVKPEGVREALLEKHPNAKNNRCLNFKSYGVYYVLDNVIKFENSSNFIELIKRFGEELQPKKAKK